MNSICETSASDYFTQKLVVGDVATHSWEYCKNLSINKKVLHVGCSDYPIFKKETNMHLYLSAFAKNLHGVDPNGTQKLREHFDGVFYKYIQRAERDYDVILVPNVIEHLKNPGLLIKQLFLIKFTQMFVLVPNYSISSQATYENGIFTERIHPDHFSWYSPYTLFNLFRKNIESNGMNCELIFFDNKSMISILITDAK